MYFSYGCSYTLRNAEYRLCLERNLDIHEGDLENQSPESSKTDLQGMLLDSEKIDELSDKNELSSKYQQTADDLHEDIGLKGLGEMPPEVKQYILHLQSHLSSVKKVIQFEEPLSVSMDTIVHFVNLQNLIINTLID